MNYEWIVTVLGAVGQVDGVAAGQAAEGAARIESVWDFIVKGGPMMIPIALSSFVALTVVIERMVSLRRKRVLPPSFVPGLREVLKESSSDKRKALYYCTLYPSPLANVLTAGVKRLGDKVEFVEKRIQEAGQREVLKLRRYLRVLAVIASIAPLMGLLGTIFGMIIAFQTVATSGEALGKAELLAKGIYQAMITTAAGLLVAIPVLLAYHWIAGKIEQLVSEMDALSVAFVEEFADRGSVFGDSNDRTSNADSGSGSDSSETRASTGGDGEMAATLATA